MSSNTKQSSVCRLCLQTSDDVINIWEMFQDSTIASILSKHFWFQVHKNDGLTESLCKICWMQTKTFHEFYEKVDQLHKRFWDSLKKDDIVGIDSKDETFESDLNLVKCEVIMLEPVDLQETNKEDVSDCESSRSQDRDREDENSNGKDERDDVASSERSDYQSRSKQRDAEIRKFFTLKCEICNDNVEFESLLKVRLHYRRVHKSVFYLTCCGKKLHRTFHALKHIRYHTDPYTCDQCGKIFRSKDTLKFHIDSHAPIDSRAFKCSLCTSSFPSVPRLRAHVKLTHDSKTGEKFPCDKCSKNFTSNIALSAHIRHVHEFPPEHVCEVCARSYKSRHGLQEHFDRTHSTTTKTPTPTQKVQCDICGIWLKRKALLSWHLKLHTVVKGLKCPICSRAMRNNRVLSSHMKSSHAERRHKCTLCDKAFKTATSLKEHIAVHTGVDLYDCPYCTKKFKSKANLYSHRKKAHLTEWTRDKEAALNTQTTKDQNLV